MKPLRPTALVLILLALVLGTLPGLAALTTAKERPSTTTEAAAALFAEEKFGEAADAFERLTALQPNDISLRFNLARALQEDGRLGEAILELERALRILPNHAPSTQLLTRLRKDSNARIFTNTATELLLRRLLPTRQQTLKLLYTSIGLFGVAVALRTLSRYHRTAAIPLGLALTTATVATVDLQFKERVGKLAILIERNAELQSAPVPKGNVLAVIPSGSQVLLGHNHAGWILARLPDGTEGWLPEKTVRTIGNPATPHSAGAAPVNG
jgi:tetratricopeptide (TPR) repeat protein